jgi:hypothetical protein
MIKLICPEVAFSRIVGWGEHRYVRERLQFRTTVEKVFQEIPFEKIAFVGEVLVFHSNTFQNIPCLCGLLLSEPP